MKWGYFHIPRSSPKQTSVFNLYKFVHGAVQSSCGKNFKRPSCTLIGLNRGIRGEAFESAKRFFFFNLKECLRKNKVLDFLAFSEDIFIVWHVI